MLLLIAIIKLRFNNIQIHAKAHNAGHFLLHQDCIPWVKNNICSEDIDKFLDDKSQRDILFPFAKDPHVFFLYI